MVDDLHRKVVLTEQHVAMENLLRNVEAASKDMPFSFSHGTWTGSQAANKSLPEDFVPAQAQAEHL